MRENIFRELVANIIVHKEYANAEPTKFLIGRNVIYTENSNRPYINGIINLDNLVTHPKNPNITKFFKEIGLVEELGSGIEKIIKYCKIYTKTEPVIKDENLFTFKLEHDLFLTKNTELSEKISSDQVSDQVFLEHALLEFCTTAKSFKEILIRFGYSNKQYFRKKILNPLIQKGLLSPTWPNSPNSPTQKYYTVIEDKVSKD